MPGSENFYNKNAKSFFDETIQVDLKSIYDKFLPHLPPNGKILDVGCGSGRDTKYFLTRGYKVTAFDQSAELCRLASAYTGIEVDQRSFNEVKEINVYDGIWACASLLHLPKAELPLVFSKLENALTQNGVVYASFKHGDFEGERGGRHFTDLTLETLWEVLANSGLMVFDSWISQDLRPNRASESWLNLLLTRKSAKALITPKLDTRQTRR